VEFKVLVDSGYSKDVKNTSLFAFIQTMYRSDYSVMCERNARILKNLGLVAESLIVHVENDWGFASTFGDW